jgi:hypothetical protein
MDTKTTIIIVSSIFISALAIILFMEHQNKYQKPAVNTIVVPSQPQIVNKYIPVPQYIPDIDYFYHGYHHDNDNDRNIIINNNNANWNNIAPDPSTVHRVQHGSAISTTTSSKKVF